MRRASLDSSSKVLKIKSQRAAPKVLLSVREAAIELFGGDDYTRLERVRKLVRSNQIKSLRDRKQYWIPRAEITRLAEPQS
jgi:hypothetical protein